MMRSIVDFIGLTAFLIWSSIGLYAQDTVRASSENELVIPDEIISRIPNSEVSQFLMARQRAIDHKEQIPADAFEEIGISKEILSRVPSSELFELLSERGYVELQEEEHNGSVNHHGPPSPQEMIKLLYLLILISGGLVLTSIVLGHLSRKKEQDVIIKALENQKEIPVDLLHSSHQRRYLNRATLLLVLSVAVVVLGIRDVVPGMLAVIPLSMAIGYYIIWRLND